MTNIYHYCGHIISKDETGRFPKSNEKTVKQVLDSYFKTIEVDSCFGSLASGADILLAETMLQKGANLQVVLPFAKKDFIRESVISSGLEWKQRFDKLLAEAKTVTQIFYKKPQDDNLSYALCSEVAMGLSILKAFYQHKLTDSCPSQLTIWDNQQTTADAGTYPDMLRWHLLELNTKYISSKQPIEINNFTDKPPLSTLPIDIVAYSKKDNTPLTEIASIDELLQFLRNHTATYFLDLNHKTFGFNKKIIQGEITDRAKGLIAYHCYHRSKTNLFNEVFQVQQPIKNSDQPFITQMDTKNFNLEMDLKQQKNVIKVNAIEAIVFYSGRILEATSTFCVTRLGEKAKSNVFANIEYINDYNLLDSQTRHWAHALRRLANQFRHILKPTEELDGKIAIILLDKWLDWLINHSSLLDKNSNTYSLLRETQNEMTEQFNWISKWLENNNSEAITDKKESPLLYQPVFASVICEELINNKEFDKVTDYLQIALDSHPDDLRLNQLKGLLLSRTGKLEEAESLLRSLLKQAPNDDETVGILAGVIKKIWQDGDVSRLNHWGKHYSKGWKLSKQRNTYLGINAAAHCLWSGNIEASAEIAKEIVHLYEHREKTIKEVLKISTNKMDYWDHATLAEAYLLSGASEMAKQYYNELFTSIEFTSKPHNIAAKQLLLHLNCSSIKSTEEINELATQYAKS